MKPKISLGCTSKLTSSKTSLANDLEISEIFRGSITLPYHSSLAAKLCNRQFPNQKLQRQQHHLNMKFGGILRV
jgi:hypothetical protein